MPELVKKCPECGGINLNWNKERGEIICKDCGLVIEEKMVDFTQEWREFDSEDGERRRADNETTYCCLEKHFVRVFRCNFMELNHIAASNLPLQWIFVASAAVSAGVLLVKTDSNQKINGTTQKR